MRGGGSLGIVCTTSPTCSRSATTARQTRQQVRGIALQVVVGGGGVRRFRRRRRTGGQELQPALRLLAEGKPSRCPHTEWWSCRRCRAPGPGSGTPGCQTWRRSGRSTAPTRQARPSSSRSTALGTPQQPRWAGEARPSRLGQHGKPALPAASRVHRSVASRVEGAHHWRQSLSLASCCSGQGGRLVSWSWGM